MSLYRNTEEVVEATKEWMENNKELYEYVSDFEQKIIDKNRR